jgi:aminoglycoside phosphotransferase (APT) family kinase protein
MSDSIENDPQARELAAALGSQYEVVRLLGRGGMGAVYLAREPFLDREVAVKVLPAELASGEARARFLREARTAARLSHPHIVPLYTFGQSGDLLFYVMGYVEGEPLEARLRRAGRLPIADARRILDELSDALHYAHARGVVHRDVKPDNVLLDRRTGRALLTDFGIAKERARGATLTRTGMVVGTPHYMSPEQASGDAAIDGRSDIYALGVIAYRMLTGHLPFQGETLQEVLSQHVVRIPLAPSKVNPEVPFEMDRVVMQALAKNPADRWQNAAAVRQALSADSEESMPEDLRGTSGGGPRMALIALAVAEVEIILNLTGFFEKDPMPVAAIAGSFIWIQVLGLLSWIGPWRRWGARATIDAYFRQPSWWTTWWPRRFRRAGDVYDRLPKAVRQVRAWNLGMIAFCPVYLNMMMYVMRPSFMAAHPVGFKWIGVYVPLAIVVATLTPVMILAHRHQRWTRARGIARIDSIRMQTESTFNARFWSRPEVAALLAGKEESPEIPTEPLKELERIARMAGSSAHAAIYREAVAAARVLHEALAGVDEELAQLFREANPAERARIKESLDALGADGGSPEKSQMRILLRQQLELFERLDARKEEVRDRRNRMMEQLRALALNVAHLRAEEANAARATTLSERIHTLCEGIGYRASAIRETEELITPN